MTAELNLSLLQRGKAGDSTPLRTGRSHSKCKVQPTVRLKDPVTDEIIAAAAVAAVPAKHSMMTSLIVLGCRSSSATFSTYGESARAGVMACDGGDTQQQVDELCGRRAVMAPAMWLGLLVCQHSASLLDQLKQTLCRDQQQVRAIARSYDAQEWQQQNTCRMLVQVRCDASNCQVVHQDLSFKGGQAQASPCCFTVGWMH